MGPIYTKDTLGPAIAKNVPQPLTFHLEQEMTVVNNGVTQHATISGDMLSDKLKSKAKMRLEMDGQGVDLLFLDGKMYINRGAATGNKWQVEEMSAPGNESAMEKLRDSNPIDDLAALGSADRLTFIGVEQVDGEDTNHYKAVFEMSASGSQTSTSEDMEVELWLDGKTHIRQIYLNQAGAEYRQTYSKWGEPVNVTAPPLSEQTTAPAN